MNQGYISPSLPYNDVLDFVVKKNEYYENFINTNPKIGILANLSDQYLIGYIDKKSAQSIEEDLGTGIYDATPLIMGLLDRASLEASGILQIQKQPFLNLKGKGVLVAVIDTGIDYTNKAFINDDGTSKIQFILDQTINTDITVESGIGTEYSNTQINEALKSPDPFSIVPSNDTVGHGTFLASVAAGREDKENPRYIGAAPEADLIIVKLKNARSYYREMYLVPPEQENAYESTAVMIGVDYILQKAQQLDRPVSICLGIGTNMGGHEGSSLFEEYLSFISRYTGVCLCNAAGNESQARHHTQGIVIKADDFTPVDIKVGENSGSFPVSIWCGSSDIMSVAIKSPTGETVNRVPAKFRAFQETKLVLEKSKVRVEYFYPVENTGSQLIVVKIFDPTPGIWTINVYGNVILNGTFHAWLPLTGFVSPNVEFLSPTPYFTIVVPATALGVLAVGAYNGGTNTLYPQSSWGPTRLPLMTPDFVAPGVDVGGVYPTGYGVMSGTSVSAAITAGACALLLQWGVIEENDPSMNTYQARAYIIRGCSRDPSLTYPNTQWGYGRLNLIQSYNLMRGI